MEGIRYFVFLFAILGGFAQKEKQKTKKKNQEALLRGVPKRNRDEENDEDLDELFGEAKEEPNADGELYLKSGVFAPRAIQREGICLFFCGACSCRFLKRKNKRNAWKVYLGVKP